MTCELCQGAARPFATAMVMGSHRAEYHRCVQCGFTFVPQPGWLAEAYQNPIADSDLGSVHRADLNARITKALVQCCFRGGRRFLDYGSGYGLFVRKMRDAGYDFHGYDPYTRNLFSPQFMVQGLGAETFALVTAFEVLEHLEHPRAWFEEILPRTGALLFTTQLMPEPAPLPGDWWYYGLDHGQHIAFYTRRSLELLAGRLGCHFCTDGDGLHLFSPRRIHPRWFRWVTSPRFSRWFDACYQRPSLLQPDWEAARERALKSAGERAASMDAGGKDSR